MKHITIENLETNTELLFTINQKIKCDEIKISCSDYYTIFSDGKVVDFGPERTAKGYSRVKSVAISNIDTFVLRVMRFGMPNLEMELQPFFLGFDVYYKNRLVLDAMGLVCVQNNSHIRTSCKFSPQRALIERYDNRIDDKEKRVLIEVKEPKPLASLGNVCDYLTVSPKLIKNGKFNGFEEITERNYLSFPQFQGVGNFDIDNELIQGTKEGFFYKLYKFDGVKTGLITFEAVCQQEGKAFIVFDEYLPNNKWCFGRSNCSDVIEVFMKKGTNKITSAVPYTMQYVNVISTYDNLNEKLTFTLIQNDRVSQPKSYNDEKVDLIVESAKNTFQQNSFDIFTDCPGRERAGWLCDSYFMGIAEHYFTGQNRIEKHFLENYILGSCCDIPEKMLPMCYPARHIDGIYIPNWAMWFVLELRNYSDNSNDRVIVDKAKEKVYSLLEFFGDYENEYGLLENLPSWVFIEWSKANDDDYIKGVSFPTNMLYCKMLKDVAYLYNDEECLKKSNLLHDAINKMSFNGEYYCDNAIRQNDKLEVCRTHISETCQYYALFLEITADKKFATNMRDNYSLPQAEYKQNIAKSNVFIGNFLRLLWLLKEKEYTLIKNEVVNYFYNMAKETKTLWEKNLPTASCNHGFTSCLAYILDKSYTG